MKALFLTIGIVIFVLLVFVCYALGMHRVVGDWAISGQIGDTFGAINAFISAFALYGVIRAFMMQREQLEEMRRATQVQVSPVMTLKEYKPYLYFYVGERGVFPLPNTGLRIEICNNSDSPIIDLDGRIVIIFPDKGNVYWSERFFWPIIEGNGGSTEGQSLSVRIGDVDSVAQFLTAIVGCDSVNPILTCHFKYKNILGAGYEYKQIYRLEAWHEKHDAKKAIERICAQLRAPDQQLKSLLDTIASKRNDMDFSQTFHRCVQEYIGGPITTNKFDNYEISMSTQKGDLVFRAISDKEYQALNFADC